MGIQDPSFGQTRAVPAYSPYRQAQVKRVLNDVAPAYAALHALMQQARPHLDAIAAHDGTVAGYGASDELNDIREIADSDPAAEAEECARIATEWA